MSEPENKYKRWSAEDLALIKLYYGVIPTEVLAECLGRSKWSIYHVARKLGLKARQGGYPKFIKIRKMPKS